MDDPERFLRVTGTQVCIIAQWDRLLHQAYATDVCPKSRFIFVRNGNRLDRSGTQWIELFHAFAEAIEPPD